MPIKQYRRGSHPYHSYRSRVMIPQKSPRSRHIVRAILAVFLFGAGVVIFIGYMKYSADIPSTSPTLIFKSQRSQDTTHDAVEWGQSQQAFGTVDDGVVAEKPSQVPMPTASTAKLITALTVLNKKPLKLGEQGPRVTMTQQDVESFNYYYAIGGSTAAVQTGVQLSEYQLLQGVLLPSANNLADTLAIWAFGSLKEYQKAAQEYVESIGAADTTVGVDASGFSPTTRSTASDLTRIGIEAAKHPVIKEIVGQKSVTLPVAGEKQNTNWLLGEDGVFGGKTGNTDEAKGVFVFMSKQMIEGKEFVMVGAVQGEPTVRDAILQSEKVITNNSPQFFYDRPIKRAK